MRETKRAYGWPEDAQFLVPDGVREHFAEGIGARGAERCAASGSELLVGYEREHESLERQIDAMQRRELPEGWDADIPCFERRREGDRDPQGLEPGPERDRRAGAVAARAARPTSPTRPRSGSTTRRGGDFEPDNRAGRQLHYGIREHESAAISNGLSLSKLRPLWSTYLTFSDYAPPGDPALGADGAAGDPHLHPRLDRARRGRPDPPAGRAARLAAGDPGPRT